MIDLDAVPIPGTSFIVRKLGGETYFLSTDGDEIHVLNEIGTYIWDTADGERTLGSILDRVCKTFDVTPETALNDLMKFVEELRKKGLVTVQAE